MGTAQGGVSIHELMYVRYTKVTHVVIGMSKNLDGTIGASKCKRRNVTLRIRDPDGCNDSSMYGACNVL